MEPYNKLKFTSGIKKAPRWAWYVVGGVGVGAFAIRMLQHRTTSSADSAATDAATANDANVAGSPQAVSSSPTGVIVPPVILSGGDTNSDNGAGMFSGVVDSATGLIATVGSVFAPIQQQNADLSTGLINLVGDQSHDIAAIAQAGSAPTPAAITPTPITVMVPTAARPAAPTPATKSPCGGDYPYYDAGGKDCYKVVCSDGKHTKDGTPTNLAPGMWHIHKNGAKVRMTTTKASCW